LSRAIIEKSKKSRKYLLNHSALDVIEGFGLEISLETKMIDEEAYKMKVQQVNAELSKLSARQRQALVLYYIDGFTQQEIADIMQLKDQHSVTKLVKRALDSIRGNVGVLLFFATEFHDFR
jgi:RNA polymerase sigma-70 factor (ECF subfamily)